jgi:hypothetical protein
MQPFGPHWATLDREASVVSTFDHSLPVDAVRVDTLIQYALAVASKEDDERDRELGPIHLLKYVYLGDLAYAEKHAGQTYTAAPWEFYKFGPWSQAVHDRIEPAAAAIEASVRTFGWQDGDREGEGIRYQATDPDLATSLENNLPFQVTSAMKKAVHKFTSCTPELLHHVYLTRPMLSAEPRARLDFTPPEKPETPSSAEKPPLTAKQVKKQKAKLEAAHEQVQEKLREKRASRKGRSELTPMPRHDEVYEKGMRWLDSLAGSALPEEGEAVFSDEIWKSRSRYDPDLS